LGNRRRVVSRHISGLFIVAALAALVWGISREYRAANQTSTAPQSSENRADTASLTGVASGFPAGEPQIGQDWDMFQPSGTVNTGVSTDLANGLSLTGMVPDGFCFPRWGLAQRSTAVLGVAEQGKAVSQPLQGVAMKDDDSSKPDRTEMPWTIPLSAVCAKR